MVRSKRAINTDVLASKYNFGINSLRLMTPFCRQIFQTTDLIVMVVLFRRKVWASKVMSRGSAAGVLVKRGFCANPAMIPPQKSQKGDHIHVVNFLRRHCM